ncbi:GxxExxY protein [Rhodohalobacter sp. 614A]|uniref:GxxExxY protein n=1 Tax=Rhodohalobacter sp. 614A TaxID=2908649 RepID=UPI001F2E4D9B|nr:GxxExxY protein [Rhodohalobacter sp. 614A]
MLLSDITEKVIGASIRVHKEPGPGLLESAYQEYLFFYVLNKEGLIVEKEKPIPVSFEDIKLDCGYRIDLLVEKKLILEIKSVEHFSPVHYAQVLTYLKLGGFKLWLLLNFNVPLMKKGIKRIIN